MATDLIGSTYKSKHGDLAILKHFDQETVTIEIESGPIAGQTITVPRGEFEQMATLLT